ncbi:MAG: hypothetical protein R3B70_48345, partial [Polyangiaceae bacterium]
MGTTGAAITIERFAEMRAEMEAGKLRDDVLARHDVGADAWTAAQRSFLSEMKEELTRGRFELSNRYTSAFLSRQEVLAAESGKSARAVGSDREGEREAVGEIPAKGPVGATLGLAATGSGGETGSLADNGPLGAGRGLDAGRAGVETGSLSTSGPLGGAHGVNATGPMIGDGSGAAGGAPGAAG